MKLKKSQCLVRLMTGMGFFCSAVSFGNGDYPKQLSELKNLAPQININNALPDLKFTHVYFDVQKKRFAEEKSLLSLFGSDKTVIFVMPGAFTPTCGGSHLPGIAGNLAKFHAKGVRKIGIVTTDSCDVLAAWLGQNNLDYQYVIGISDIDREWLAKVGLLRDGGRLRVSGKRAVLIIEDGTIRAIEVEDDAAQCGISSAANALDLLDGLTLGLDQPSITIPSDEDEKQTQQVSLNKRIRLE